MISKCRNNDCPSKLDCERFTRPANRYWQSYSPFEPQAGEIACDMFVRVWPRTKVEKELLK